MTLLDRVGITPVRGPSNDVFPVVGFTRDVYAISQGKGKPVEPVLEVDLKQFLEIRDIVAHGVVMQM